MKILPDTHVFLWFISGDSQLPANAKDAIRDRNNEVYLSVASVWEAVIKHQLGKLPLPKPPEVYLPEERQRHQISSSRHRRRLHDASGRLAAIAQTPV